MYQEIEIRESTARKNYRCDWCDKIIPKGEKYIRQKYIYDGEFCTWRAHCACQRVTDAIWDYADPDDGLDSDGFYEYGGEVCRRFICPDCPKWSGNEYDGCEDGDSLCIDRMDEFFKTHELYCTREGYYEIWRARKKEEKDEAD